MVVIDSGGYEIVLTKSNLQEGDKLDFIIPEYDRWVADMTPRTSGGLNERIIRYDVLLNGKKFDVNSPLPAGSFTLDVWAVKYKDIENTTQPNLWHNRMKITVTKPSFFDFLDPYLEIKPIESYPSVDLPGEDITDNSEGKNSYVIAALAIGIALAVILAKGRTGK